MRIGQGFDAHQFRDGDHVVLGGVKIPFERSLAAHSDGDVLLHAICDALLGAAALGDIGRHFPDSKPEYKGIDSRILLRHVAALIREAGFQIANVDATLICERPRVSPHVNLMCEYIAQDLALTVAQVNVKGTTTEKMGFAGREEGIAASAVALLETLAPPATGRQIHMSQAKSADLEALWAEHVKYEFETSNTEDTLATMVEDAYVNHIPVMTGGVGKAELREFYAKHFIPQMPPDTEMVPLSRTVGADRLVDEMVFKFTHTIPMDWMLPGIAPTGRRVEVALVAIVHFRDGKLAYEHIYWDQASVLVQIGLLNPDGLPVAGVEAARKALQPTLPSNTLMAR